MCLYNVQPALASLLSLLGCPFALYEYFHFQFHVFLSSPDSIYKRKCDVCLSMHVTLPTRILSESIYGVNALGKVFPAIISKQSLTLIIEFAMS